MTDKPKKWTIKRWSGHDNDLPKFRYIDSEERARAIYAKLYAVMRQGMVELFDGE
jgi:hypothetical protein